MLATDSTEELAHAAAEALRLTGCVTELCACSVGAWWPLIVPRYSVERKRWVILEGSSVGMDRYRCEW